MVSAGFFPDVNIAVVLYKILHQTSVKNQAGRGGDFYFI